jgi:hypothetical protein
MSGSRSIYIVVLRKIGTCPRSPFFRPNEIYFRVAGDSGRGDSMVDNNLVSNEAYVNCGRLQLVALRLAMLSCIQLAAAPMGLLAQTVTIHVRVLDGRTGHYLSGKNLAFVDYHTDDNGGHHDDLNGRMTVKTSVDGDSYVASPDDHGVLVFNGMGINGAWTPCTRQRFYDSNTRTYGNEHLYPVSMIVASGLVAKNNCSKISAAAKPGELVIFIRPATWWEKFVSGMES